jgi:hypothetical protein
MFILQKTAQSVKPVIFAGAISRTGFLGIE